MTQARRTIILPRDYFAPASNNIRNQLLTIIKS